MALRWRSVEAKEAVGDARSVRCGGRAGIAGGGEGGVSGTARTGCGWSAGREGCSERRMSLRVVIAEIPRVGSSDIFRRDLPVDMSCWLCCRRDKDELRLCSVDCRTIEFVIRTT